MRKIRKSTYAKSKPCHAALFIFKLQLNASMKWENADGMLCGYASLTGGAMQYTYIVFRKGPKGICCPAFIIKCSEGKDIEMPVEICFRSWSHFQTSIECALGTDFLTKMCWMDGMISTKCSDWVMALEDMNVLFYSIWKRNLEGLKAMVTQSK